MSRRSRSAWVALVVPGLSLWCFLGFPAPGGDRRTPVRAEGEAWREAYDVELERNQLLREQLKIEDMELPEVCEVDWQASYEMLGFAASFRGWVGWMDDGYTWIYLVRGWTRYHLLYCSTNLITRNLFND